MELTTAEGTAAEGRIAERTTMGGMTAGEPAGGQLTGTAGTRKERTGLPSMLYQPSCIQKQAAAMPRDVAVTPLQCAKLFPTSSVTQRCFECFLASGPRTIAHSLAAHTGVLPGTPSAARRMPQPSEALQPPSTPFPATAASWTASSSRGLRTAAMQALSLPHSHVLALLATMQVTFGNDWAAGL